MTKKQLIGRIILLLTNVIWGLGFIFQDKAAMYLSTFTINAFRGFVGGLLLLSIALIRKSINKDNIKKSIVGGAICGIFLGIAMNFQQFGIGMYPEGVNSLGRAGFLTTLYVFFVPIIQIVSNKKLSINIIIGSIISIVGIYFLCFSGGFENVYLSDLLLLLCALAYALQIIFVSKYKDIDSVTLTGIQFLVAGIISFVLALIFDKVNMDSFKSAIPALLYLSIISGALAYFMQVFGEKLSDNATIDSILMSFEAVFATLFACLLVGELLSVKEIIGCVLMTIALIVANITINKKKNMENGSTIN